MTTICSGISALRRQVAHERDGAALAHAADGRVDRGRRADDFERRRGAAAAGGGEDRRDRIAGLGVERERGAELLGQREPIVVDVDGEDATARRRLGGPESPSRPIMPAPTTTTSSPADSGVIRTACTATDTASIRAACSSGTSSGRAYMMRSGTATNSAKAPCGGSRRRRRPAPRGDRTG